MIVQPDDHSGPPGPSLKVIKTRIQKRGLTRVLAEEIIRAHNFSFDSGDQLYVYTGGVYRGDGEDFVLRRITSLLETWRKSARWVIRLQKEVSTYIRSVSPKLWDAPPINVVNVLNGLLNVETGDLRPHMPKHLSPIQIPVRFDPEASCPAWDTFVSEVVENDQVAAVWEMFGISMVPDRSIQQAVFLTGSPGTGKSTLLGGLKTFIGPQNVTTLDLNRLEKNRFATSRLLGKLVNIASDISNEELRDVSNFKAITGGDAIEGEVKYKSSFTFEPYCNLVFSANHYPRVLGASDAFMDRCYVISMERRFRQTDKEVSRHVLAERLADPRELSGVLNRAIQGLANLRARGRFPDVESARAAHSEMRDANDQLGKWLEKYTVRVAEGLLPQKHLVTTYNRWANDNGLPTILSRAMSDAVKRAYPDTKLRQRQYRSDSRVRCWVGLSLSGRSPP